MQSAYQDHCFYWLKEESDEGDGTPSAEPT